MSDHVVILKTGRLHDLEMACNALKESGIAHYRQSESSSGLKTAMVTPAMGPGSYWNILVPVSEKNLAEKVLSELPFEITTNPDIWHHGAKSESKKGWKVFIIVMLSIVGLIFLFNLIR